VHQSEFLWCQRHHLGMQAPRRCQLQHSLQCAQCFFPFAKHRCHPVGWSHMHAAMSALRLKTYHMHHQCKVNMQISVKRGCEKHHEAQVQQTHDEIKKVILRVTRNLQGCGVTCTLPHHLLTILLAATSSHCLPQTS
jgi:hypothetical protein